MDTSQLRANPNDCSGAPSPGVLTQWQVDQILKVVAEDHLSGEKDQWPIKVPPSQALHNARSNATLEEIADAVIGESRTLAKRGTKYGERIDPLFLSREERRSTQPEGLHHASFYMGAYGKDGIRIDRVLSSGTAQGVVYTVSVTAPLPVPLPPQIRRPALPVNPPFGPPRPVRPGDGRAIRGRLPNQPAGGAKGRARTLFPAPLPPRPLAPGRVGARAAPAVARGAGVGRPGTPFARGAPFGAGGGRGREVAIARPRPGPSAPDERMKVVAVLKKSALYSVPTWYNHVATSQLIQLIRSIESEGRDPASVLSAGTPQRQKALALLSWSSLLGRGSDSEKREALSWAMEGPAAKALDSVIGIRQTDLMLRNLSRKLADTSVKLADQYNDPDNESYIDAVGYYLGSRLVDADLSPGFGLLYGTYRADDDSFFDDDRVAQEVMGREALSRSFPVQATVLQLLGSDVYKLVDEGFFGGMGKPLRRDRVMSLFAQVTIALAIGQRYFGMIHNDLHCGNVLEEDVPSCQALYFFGAKAGGSVLKVPTFGKVYKIIDFGRARFTLPDWGTFGGKMQRKVWMSKGGKEEWNDAGRSNDLVRFVSAFVLYTGSKREIWGPSGRGHGADPFNLGAFVRHVLGCGKWRDVFSHAEACGVDTGCRAAALDFDPFKLGSPCTQGVPSELGGFFEMYAVDRSEVPEGAPIYGGI